MTLFALTGAVQTGLIFAVVALGAFISFRILNFPDMTVEGSFPLGAAVAAVFISRGANPLVAMLAGTAAGFLAGITTAFLNQKMKIIGILAGVLTSIALYSVNLRIMGRPNIAFLDRNTIFDDFPTFGVPSYIRDTAVVLGLLLVIKFAVDRFLLSGYGLSMRAAGANPRMAGANGIDVERTVFLGLGLANALTALAGALFAQIIGAADVSMGIGVVIVAFASVIAGQTLVPSRVIVWATAGCVLGSIVYRLAIAFALNGNVLGLTASDLNIVTAALVALAMVNPARLRALLPRMVARRARPGRAS